MQEMASVFTEAEIAYLRERLRGTIGTVGPDGQPHLTPTTLHYNEHEDAIDVGGVSFGSTKKWRDASTNPRVTVLVEDVLQNPRRARAIEVRGTAELHETGGASINPRFANFDPRFLRIRPTRIVSWGLEEAAMTAGSFTVNARTVG